MLLPILSRLSGKSIVELNLRPVSRFAGIHFSTTVLFIVDVKIFVAIDIICLFVQSAGGVIASSSNTNTAGKIGTDVFLAGISFQLG